MAKRVIGKQRLATITKLNKQATRKINRLKTKYDVMVDVVVKDPSTFTSVKEYNAYVKRLEHFTDRRNYRYVELQIPAFKVTDHKEVVDYSVYQDWAKQQRLANKQRRKALADRLEFINQAQKRQYTMKEIEQDPILAKKLNVASLIPSKVNTKAFRERFESKEGVKYSYNKLYERNLNPDYFNDRDENAKNNFIQALHETFSGVIDSDKLDKLSDHIENMSLAEWQRVLYTFREDPFEFMYLRGASAHRYNQTVKKFRLPKNIENELLQE